MSSPSLTKKQALELRETLSRARGGRSSLGELGTACDLASAGGLPGVAAELRAHLREAARDHAEPGRKASRDVMFGIATGIVTHVLLGNR